MISKNKKYILAWSHFVTNHRTSNPWKTGQRLWGREAAGFALLYKEGQLLSQTPPMQVGSSHCSDNGITPNRAGQRFCRIPMTGAEVVTYNMCLHRYCFNIWFEFLFPQLLYHHFFHRIYRSILRCVSADLPAAWGCWLSFIFLAVEKESVACKVCAHSQRGSLNSFGVPSL